MTPKEFFMQAHRIDHKIKSDMDELDRLRELSTSISSIQMGDRVQSSANDARFVRCIDSIQKLEQEIGKEVEIYVKLKEQIRQTIETAKSPDEQVVLKYRYLSHMSWERISDALFADRTTIYRWHQSALNHVKMPKEPIII